jgi:hypothetical protein
MSFEADRTVSIYIEELQEVVRQSHGVPCTHIDSVPVREIVKGKTVWGGIVEVFELHGHPRAPIAYAWARDTDDPEKPRKHFAFLHLHPIDSPEAAVRAAIAAEEA